MCCNIFSSTPKTMFWYLIHKYVLLHAFYEKFKENACNDLQYRSKLQQILSLQACEMDVLKKQRENVKQKAWVQCSPLVRSLFVVDRNPIVPPWWKHWKLEKMILRNTSFYFLVSIDILYKSSALKKYLFLLNSFGKFTATFLCDKSAPVTYILF